jgi:hypothetical protein
MFPLWDWREEGLGAKSVGPIDGRNIGVELEWAESVADSRAGKFKTVRLFLRPEAAEDFAAELRRQVEAARLRERTSRRRPRRSPKGANGPCPSHAARGLVEASGVPGRDR